MTKETEDEKRESVWGTRKGKTSFDTVRPAPKPSAAPDLPAVNLCPRCGVGILSTPSTGPDDVCIACKEGWWTP